MAERKLKANMRALKDLPEVQGEPTKKAILALNGKLITAEDPMVIGKNFRTLDNMRYGDQSPKTIGGMTKINSAALSARPCVRNAFHYRKTNQGDL